MVTVTGFTALRMLQIENESINDGNVNGSGHLILVRRDLTEIDAGSVIGPTGATGPTGPAGAGAAVLDELTDVATAGLASGSLLRYNGTLWVPATIPLDELSDVNTAGAVSGHALVFNGTSWLPTSIVKTAIGASIHRTATQTVPTGTNTVINFTAEEFDSSGFHDNATNNSRITIPTGLGGKYRTSAKADFSPSVAGRRTLIVRKNGSTTVFSFNNGMATGEDVNDNAHLAATRTVPLVAGDYIEMLLLQTSGADRLCAADPVTTNLEVIYEGV